MNKYPQHIAVTLEYLISEGNRINIPGILPRRRLHTLLSGSHASMMRGRGLDFEEVRQYRRGDDIKDIDWKVTARTQKTHVKVYNEEKERPAMVLVDQCSDLFFGSVQNVKSVQAAVVAAIAAFGTLKRKDRVGGLIVGDNETQFIRPQRSQQSVLKFLNLLAEENQKLPSKKQMLKGATNLANALSELSGFVNHDYTIFVITDAGKITKTAKKHLNIMARHNDVIFIHISDPLDKEIPQENWVFTDGEMQVYYSKKEISAHKVNHDTLKEELLQYRIPTVEIDTKRSVMEQMVELIGKLS